MCGVETKLWKSKIAFDCWYRLAVSCSTTMNDSGSYTFSSAKTVLSKGVTAFHWRPVGKFRFSLTHQDALVLLLEFSWWYI